MFLETWSHETTKLAEKRIGIKGKMIDGQVSGGTMIDKKYSDNLRKSISDTMSFTEELHNHKLRSVSTLIQYYYGTIWPTFLISSRSAFGCKYCSHSSGQALN